MNALGAPHTGERSEGQLIRDFIEKIGQLRPQLITFNGHSFDLPVLRYRAMVNRVPAAGLRVRRVFPPLHGGRARPLRRVGLVRAERKSQARRRQERSPVSPASAAGHYSKVRMLNQCRPAFISAE